MIIQAYNESRDYKKICALFHSEKDWEYYTCEENRDKYQDSLQRSITFIAYIENELVGYVRAIEDFNFYIYICDLLVHHNHRGYTIGKKLMEAVKDIYPEYSIFVMSDVDDYYKKLEYSIEGTIFKIP